MLPYHKIPQFDKRNDLAISTQHVRPLEKNKATGIATSRRADRMLRVRFEG